MGKKFVLCIEYGTGKSGMIVETPDITEALQLFLNKCRESLPDSKDIGLPAILKAEILPLVYSEGKEEFVR